jgi:hypothetical protein
LETTPQAQGTKEKAGKSEFIKMKTFFFSALRVQHLLGKGSATELHPQPQAQNFCASK